jgi:amidohydrolase
MIPASVRSQTSYMVALRRHFHADPELSFDEHRTAARVAQELRELPELEVWDGVGRTGVVALLRGGAGPGPCVAFRADMDALPLQETGDLPFKSQNAGVMHCCGHDGHMASLLGAVRVLYAERQTLRGTIKFVFQPAEEGFGGARYMIADGVLEEGKQGPRVDWIFGARELLAPSHHQCIVSAPSQHCRCTGGKSPCSAARVCPAQGCVRLTRLFFPADLWSYAKLGEVGVREGPMMAGSDKFACCVKGKGGHGAAPQSTVDSIIVASHLVTALQTVVSRSIDPLQPAVLTVGQMNGGSGYNIICDSVQLTGTTRCFTPETQQVIKERMATLCDGVGRAFGAEIELEYTHGYPPTINNSKEGIAYVRAAAAEVVGEGNLNSSVQTCGAEDFSYFLQQRPGAFFFVGAALPGELRPHHKSVFDFDEAALDVSAAVFVGLADLLLRK